MTSSTKNNSFKELHSDWQSYCKKIRDIAQPIFEELKITVFRYSRVNAKNQKLTLTTNKHWLKQYFSEQFFTTELIRFEDYVTGDNGISLHGPCSSNHPTCLFWNRHAAACNYKYILCIYQRFEEYLEVCDFALAEDDHAGGNKLLNNSDILKQFIIYFKMQSHDIIKNAPLLSIPPLTSEQQSTRYNFLLGLNEQSRQNISTKMPINTIYLNGLYEDVKITLAEAKCLKLYVKGFKYKDIAKAIGISDRTVESHIQSARQKMSITNRETFIKTIHDQGIYEILEYIQI